jgi:hypothetical protein
MFASCCNCDQSDPIAKLYGQGLQTQAAYIPGLRYIKVLLHCEIWPAFESPDQAGVIALIAELDAYQ